VHRWRIAWTVGSIVIAEIALCAASALLPALLLRAIATTPCGLTCAAGAAAAAVPCYVLFAITLMFLSALCSRVTGWRTAADLDEPVAAFTWPLLDWVRYMVLIHVVRLFAGSILRATPVWTGYLRMNGACIGRRVYVNSLSVSDHNLLDFGDDVIVGDSAHVSGHTIEHGRLRTARVRLGDGVTVGLGAVVEIGVEAGSGCQIGALTVVPKYTHLDARATYAGIPAHRIA